jgi:glycosyltransferase involved in cell wall biosynthesis
LRWDAYAATPYAALAAARGLRRIMRQTPIDIVHADWLVPAAPIAAWALRGHDQPLVVSCHGSGVFLAEKRGWAASAARWGLQGAAALTACSRDLTERVSALIPTPEAEWIPYGVDLERFRPASAQQRVRLRQTLGARFAVPADAPWVLAVGRLVYKKGFENLVRSMAAVRADVADAQLLIAGDGPLRDDLLRAATESGVADSVHLVGAVSHAGLPELYSAADIVAVPSVHGPGGNVDGLPNVFLEGFASGTAVVASRVGGIPDIGRDGETVELVAEGDVDALGTAITGLLQDTARRAALGAAARADAELRLGWDPVAERFERLYQEALRR